MKLTARTVAGLVMPAGKTDHFEWDDELKGFGFRLRLGAAGKVLRSWVCQYRRLGGQTRRLLLGSAEAVGAEFARTMARKALGKVANGADPQAERVDRRAKDRHTFKAVVDDFLAMKRRDVRPRTYTELVRYLSGPYFKPLHSLPLDQITKRDVANRLNHITLESGSIVAARARSQISALFSWAMAHGGCEANPTIGTVRPKVSQPRERVLDDSELARVWHACLDDDYGRIVRLLICTGCRRQEIGSIAWSEIDLGRDVWVLPAARSKNGRQHVLPIMPMMRTIIEAVPRIASRDQMFGTRRSGFTNWQRGKAALDRRSGVENWCVHDVRRSVATRMADLGIGPHIVEEILNHRSGHRSGPAGIYNRSRYTSEVKSALGVWESHLRGLIDGTVRAAHGHAETIVPPSGPFGLALR
jgi:integrase